MFGRPSKSAKEITGADARAMAIRYLSRRDYSCQELERKLVQRGCDSVIAEETVAELAEHDLVSDERFAEVFCRHRVSSLYGPMRIRAELRRKGVSSDIASQAMAPFEDQWYELAWEWACRKYKGELDEKTRARLYRGGTNRGFSHDQVMRAIDRLRQND